MAKILKIEKCWECTHSVKFACDHPQFNDIGEKHFDNYPETPDPEIPAWCPLDDEPNDE